ncbi:hypothetical protein ACH492_07405 [Streptomyces sp. NPDC019443]|uniref:hypothetical protein n=1 Tax=Streptomyces sp. NPDC019443 TaxID=3365061 RepID=UPI00378EABFB
MDKKDWIAAIIGIAGIGATLGLGISNSIDQEAASAEQEVLQKEQTELAKRMTESQEQIASLQALGTATKISWSVDSPTWPTQLTVENRSDGSLHGGMVLLRHTRSPNSAVKQYMHIGSIPTCIRLKLTFGQGLQPHIQNINKGFFVFQLDSGFWSRPYTAGLTYLKSSAPGVNESASDISSWAKRKEEKILGCG